jgi:hypothetical protein
VYPCTAPCAFASVDYVSLLSAGNNSSDNNNNDNNSSINNSSDNSNSINNIIYP